MNQSLIASPQPSIPSPGPPSASEDNPSDDDIDFEPATEESDELEYGADEIEDNEDEETEGEVHGESAPRPLHKKVVVLNILLTI